MSIRVECHCGTTLNAYDFFAGGHIKCEACGEMVSIPDRKVVQVEKIRFVCPHCETRVVAKLTSVGKQSKCPACSETYTIPQPSEETEPSPAGFVHNERFTISPDDIVLLSESARDLERKTELPSNDDTERTPNRPIPLPKSGDDPIPLLDYVLPPQAVVPPASNRQEPPATIRKEGEVVLPLIAKADDELPFADTLPTIVDQLPIAENNSSPTNEVSAPPLIDQQLDEKLVHQPIIETPPDNTINLVEPTEPTSGTTAPLPANRIDSSPLVETSQISPVSRPGIRASIAFDDKKQAEDNVKLHVRNFLIGRERDCHFRPRSRSISHYHCVLKTDPFAVRIRDLGSHNGTFVNGHRIHGEVILHHSDDVLIGDVAFKVDIPDDLYSGFYSADAQLSLDEFVIF